jgi:hypothetical protein
MRGRLCFDVRIDMLWLKCRSVVFGAALFAAAQVSLLTNALAQGVPGGGGAGIPVAAPAGIKIDPNGVVSSDFTRDKTGKLSQKRRESAAQENLSADVNTPSELRKVSLVRLEKACSEYLDQGETPPNEMQFLAGLNRIDYVFVYPESKDLVIAGPAEGFAPDEDGRVTGLESDRPPLRLDDLIVALRAVESSQQLGCSIDPEPEKLAAMLRFNAQNSTAASDAEIRRRFVRMRDIIGLENVSVFGVPSDSHFARVLVEADYRMKLISVGLEKPRIRGLPSHLALLKPQGNAMQRWWITPLYEAFYRSDDGNAYEISGQRAQLLSQDEQVSQAGQRTGTAFTRVTTQKFSAAFTEKYPELAREMPVFAELQNLIDLSIVAALFKKEQLQQKVGWEMPVFRNPQKITYAKGSVPQHVESVMNMKTSGSVVLGLVGGGVSIMPSVTIRQVEFKSGEARRLSGRRSEALNQEPPESHPWWWD